MKKNSDQRPGLNVLARYARGDRASMKFWSKFIEEDAESRSDAALLGRLSRLIDAVDFRRTLPASTDLAASIFRGLKADGRTESRSTAHLYFDSRSVPLPEGVRSSLSSQYRLKYQTDTGQVELSVVPVYPGRFELTGRFEGEVPGETVEVRLKGRKTLRGQFDRYGFFSFPEVNPGVYSLSFQTSTGPVVISHLEL